MKAQMPRIKGKKQLPAIGTRGKNIMQLFAECGNSLPVSAGNVGDHIPSFQEKTEDGFAPESRRVEHREAGHIIPKDKTLFIRYPLAHKVFMQNAQNRFFRPFELILSSTEEKAIRAKPLFSPATELDTRVIIKLPLTDFTADQHDNPFPLAFPLPY